MIIRLYLFFYSNTFMNAKIALITGGFTGEAEVSLKSANFVEEHLDKERYDVYKIVITPQSWFHVDENGIKYEVERKDFSLIVHSHKITFDLAFIMIHGSPGEDGKLQGYLDMIDLPYTSCGTLTSAITMNKAYTKNMLTDIANLYQASSLYLNSHDKNWDVQLSDKKLNFPVFVKPNQGGSSIGMSKVNTPEELPQAVERAFHVGNTDKQVLIEEFVNGREFSVGVFPVNDGLQVLPSTEVKTSRDFFDFEAKYTPGLTKEITPADLTKEQQERIESIVKAIYNKLNCQGMVRIDYFLQDQTDRFYFIEINTIPGQTAQSFIPQQIRAFGWSEKDFYSNLIEQALRKNQ